MPSNKTIARLAGRVGLQESTARWILLGALAACIPFAVWLIGSGIAWAAPPSYSSAALLRVEEGCSFQDLKSGAVMDSAAAILAQGASSSGDPMSTYLLWSSVTVAPGPAANLVKVEARCDKAEEARRTVVAVAEAYRAQHGANASATGKRMPTLVYVDPVEAAPARVADETRMMLGIAGVALIGLALCVPFLRYIEEVAPMKRVVA
jgi:hypothetical protein